MAMAPKDPPQRRPRARAGSEPQPGHRRTGRSPLLAASLLSPGAGAAAWDGPRRSSWGEPKAACFCAIGCLPWLPLASRNPAAHRGCGAVIPQRHAPHPRRPHQPPRRPCRYLGGEPVGDTREAHHHRRLIGPELLGRGLQEGHQDCDQQDVVPQGGIEGLIAGITGVLENLLQGHPDQRGLTCASR